MTREIITGIRRMIHGKMFQVLHGADVRVYNVEAVGRETSGGLNLERIFF